MKRRLFEGEAVEAAKLLNDHGWRDARIGRALGFSGQTILRWRQAEGIDPRPREMKVDQLRVRSLLSAGVTDCEIARIFDVNQSYITHLRHSMALPANGALRPKMSEEERRKANSLLRRGMSRRQVADDLGRSVHSIQRLRAKIRNKDPLRKTGQTVAADRHRLESEDPSQLLERIKTAVGPFVSPDIADEAVGEMCLALHLGWLHSDDIEKRAKEFRNRVLGSFASKHGPRSLDEEGDFGRSLVETIEDENAEAAMDEAVALWMDHDD